jgi:hypothetical protein
MAVTAQVLACSLGGRNGQTSRSPSVHCWPKNSCAGVPARICRTIVGVTPPVRNALFAVLVPMLLGCTSDSREDPSPREMCRQLTRECSEWGEERLDECAEIGQAGLGDPTREDQCFVFYDGCIDECRFRALWGVAGNEAGGDRGDADSDRDRVDSGSGMPDASALRDAAADGG